MFIVYALLNKEANKIYIGQTEDIDRRLNQHNDKNNFFSEYTKKYKGEWKILYTEKMQTRKEAIIRERQLKTSRGRFFIKGLIK